MIYIYIYLLYDIYIIIHIYITSQNDIRHMAHKW